MENKRLTWEEMKEKYPHQNVGLVDIEPFENFGGVKSAIVECTDKTKSYEELVDMAITGKIRLMYTTMDEDELIGVLEEDLDERLFN